MSQLGNVLRSLVFYVVFYVGTAGYVLVALALLPFGRGALQRVVLGWSRFHRRCTRWILGIRLVVEGELPSSRVLVAMKHESFFEAIDLPSLLPMPAIIAKAELLRIPLWGRAGELYGLIGVERDQGARALRTMLTQARAVIDAGRLMAIFPEGTRVPSGRRVPLGSGFAGLYKMLRLPVVPIALDSGRLYHRTWKRPGLITVRVGEPIPAGLPREELEARVLEAINVLNHPSSPA
ncbi:1-acyl-sn-glycerol-3-phosphate acyltransferase [Novosphingobium chloroacetimidivorans]|uniref:1-acyl-sn-glycerol-3-phosphate acyltransferase n=1 Tax=Novosphingobium chloroacetimidivorans TaxID=1428314 RepID=A0A7W7K8B2_9SPHN|nr:lysophospholipid acyltransferase family protein [Novosphingobium chloroacetimidivorans]MBB4857544.1 1-acyl-sn-glycerol-3-phosphate acyltransferase [Novosphingobium chloroacetimidivorans]